ncbi:MAG: hypothetical protein R3E53_20695 [Myxococcota bacterium]
MNEAKTFHLERPELPSRDRGHSEADPSLRHDGMSLLLVEADTPASRRGRNLDKIEPGQT